MSYLNKRYLNSDDFIGLSSLLKNKSCEFVIASSEILSLVLSNDLIVVEDLSLESSRTKDFVRILNNLSIADISVLPRPFGGSTSSIALVTGYLCAEYL